MANKDCDEEFEAAIAACDKYFEPQLKTNYVRLQVQWTRQRNGTRSIINENMPSDVMEKTLV